MTTLSPSSQKSNRSAISQRSNRSRSSHITREDQIGLNNGGNRENSVEVAYLVSCIIQVKTLLQLLTTVKLGVKEEDGWALFEISDFGIRVQTQMQRSYNCTLAIKKETFPEYRYLANEKVQFMMNISNLITCLQMYGKSMGEFMDDCTVALRFPDEDQTVNIRVSENDVTTTCLLKTKEPTPMANFGFKDQLETAKLILRSDVFKDMLSDLLWVQEQSMTIAINEDGLVLRTALIGMGTFENKLPHDAKAIHQFKCHENVSEEYNLEYLQHFSKCLNTDKCERLQLSFNSSGLLRIKCHYDFARPVYVVYTILNTKTSREENDDMSDEDDSD